jgi:pilus assembly protein CpaF
MNSEIYKKIEQIFQKQKQNSHFDFEDTNKSFSMNTDLIQIIELETKSNSIEVQKRISDELNGYGPIACLINDESVTEILINTFDQIFFEKNGFLIKHEDHFFSEATFAAFIDRISQQCHTFMNRDKPFIETQLNNLRITIIFSELSRGSNLVSIRKQPKKLWTLEGLEKLKWCNSLQVKKIEKIISDKKNFIVIGGTGSGKTSFLQALLQSLTPLERTVLIEDTQELHPPNLASVSLLTRQDPSRSVSDVTMDDLLKRALRLRPDRLVVGEIRGPEAKSLLMMMATGHDGSFGSIHARTASEALLRLEMLVQMGAPQWTLQSIRKLMAMTIQNIFVVEKENGVRKLKGIYEVTSLEENGLTLQKVDEPDLF